MKTLQMGPLTTLKHRVARLGFGVSLAAMLALGAAMPALAAPGDGTVVLTGGNLTATQAAFAFTGVTLSGAAQVTTASAPIEVVDATGSSLGWNVTMNMGAFTDGAKTLVGAPRVTAGGITGGAVAGSVSYATPITVDGAASKIGNATAADTSNGTFTFTPTVEIDVPANALAGSYTSVAVITVTSAP